MSMENDREIRVLLKRAIAPVNPGELQRDLWPEMLRRLDERPRRLPWFDWALLAAVAACVLASPKMIPILLFHL